jgi:site-specific DNA-methyltransferase (adenine-specific)
MPKSETFNMDCLEYMKKCKDQQFSLLFTDPPYGDSGTGEYTNRDTGRFGPMFEKYHTDLKPKSRVNHASGGNTFGKYGNECQHWDFAPSEEWWNEAWRIADHLFIWGGNYFDLPPSRNFIIWLKPVAEDFSLAQMEYCWVSIPGNSRIIRARSQDKFRFHPCLPAGEKVFFSGEWKNIENVRLGEKNQYGYVSSVTSHIADYVVEIQSEGYITRATGNHPFLILRNNKVYWIEARFIKPDDILLFDLRIQRNFEWKEKTIWQELNTRPKKDISERYMRTENFIWSIVSFGKTLTARFLTVCKYITKMVTKRTIALKISSLSIPLHTSGITLVADLSTEFGKNSAKIVRNGFRLPKIIGIFISRVYAMLDILLEGNVENAQSKRLSRIGVFGLRKVGNVQKIEGEISVYNISIDGVPAFSTQIGESHNTQKPISTFLKPLEWNLKHIDKEKGILDPFMGSGTSRLAAWNMGINYVGIELNETYFQKQEDRFIEHIARGNLYNDEIKVVESEEGLF